MISTVSAQRGQEVAARILQLTSKDLFEVWQGGYRVANTNVLFGNSRLFPSRGRKVFHHLTRAVKENGDLLGTATDGHSWVIVFDSAVDLRVFEELAAAMTLSRRRKAAIGR